MAKLTAINTPSMSNARETANCSFIGITHISEKISRCCLIAVKDGVI